MAELMQGSTLYQTGRQIFPDILLLVSTFLCTKR